MTFDSRRPSFLSRRLLRLAGASNLGIRAFAAIAAALPAASAFALAPQTDGSWTAPWTWLSGTGGCEQAEFAHAALIPAGSLRGTVLLWKNTNCSQDDLETWIFDPAFPTMLGQVPTDFQSNIFCSGLSWNWQGHLLVTGGIRTPGPTPKETYRFVPHVLNNVKVFPTPPCGPCNPHYLVTVYPHWLLVGEMSVPRYYATLVPLNRFAIQSTSLLVGGQPSPLISGSGHLLLGGPTLVPPSTITQGNDLWQVFDHDSDDWSHTLVPAATMVSTTITGGREVYAEMPLTDPVDPQLDTYPRGFQLAEMDLIVPAIRGQVFVANDVDSDYDPTIPPPSPPGSTWVIKPPTATLSGGWEMWHGQDEFTDPGDCPGGNAPNCFKDRFYGTAVLMHTIQEKNRVLVFGGSQDPADYNPVPDPNRCPSTWGVNDSVWEHMPDLNQGDPVRQGSWRQKADLNEGRIFLNAVTLPTGQILIVGGDANDTALSHHDNGVECTGGPGPSNPVLVPELYDPGQMHVDLGSKRVLATSVSQIPRLYHHLAVLLPDASVLVAGGDGPLSSFSGEIFRPPYFDLGTRPLILDAPMAVSFTTSSASPVQFDVEVNVFHAEIAKLVLLRPAALTHHADMDQRYIELVWSIDPSDDPYADGTGTLIVDVPHETIGPAGYYMLFVVEVKEGGIASNLDDLIPSQAHFIRLKNR